MTFEVTSGTPAGNRTMKLTTITTTPAMSDAGALNRGESNLWQVPPFVGPVPGWRWLMP